MPFRATQFDFSENSIVVTGGTRGIGLAIARAFLAARATVTITGTRAADAYDEDHSNLIYQRCDMRRPEDIHALANTLSGVDVLVNNAGMNIRPPAALTPEAFDDTLMVNLSAVYQVCNAFYSGLKRRKGAVVNIGSVTARYASPSPGYSASKAGIVNLTMSLASAWAEEGIRVNNVAPGWIATEMNQDLRSNSTVAETALKHTPMNRWGRAEDIANAVLFLASDNAAFITGVTLPVDGGYSTR